MSPINVLSLAFNLRSASTDELPESEQGTEFSDFFSYFSDNNMGYLQPNERLVQDAEINFSAVAPTTVDTPHLSDNQVSGQSMPAHTDGGNQLQPTAADLGSTFTHPDEVFIQPAPTALLSDSASPGKSVPSPLLASVADSLAQHTDQTAGLSTSASNKPWVSVTDGAIAEATESHPILLSNTTSITTHFSAIPQVPLPTQSNTETHSSLTETRPLNENSPTSVKQSFDPQIPIQLAKTVEASVLPQQSQQAEGWNKIDNSTSDTNSTQIPLTPTAAIQESPTMTKNSVSEKNNSPQFNIATENTVVTRKSDHVSNETGSKHRTAALNFAAETPVSEEKNTPTSPVQRLIDIPSTLKTTPPATPAIVARPQPIRPETTVAGSERLLDFTTIPSNPSMPLSQAAVVYQPNQSLEHSTPPAQSIQPQPLSDQATSTSSLNIATAVNPTLIQQPHDTIVSLNELALNTPTFFGNETTPEMLTEPSSPALNTEAFAQQDVLPTVPVTPTAPASSDTNVTPTTKLTAEFSPQSEQWQEQLNEKINWYINQRISSADIQLNPKELGPLQIKIDYADHKVDINFMTSQPQVRELMEHTLPQLREFFENQGIDLNQVTVSADHSRHQHQHRSPEQQSPAKWPTNSHTPDYQKAPALKTQQVQEGLIDYYA